MRYSSKSYSGWLEEVITLGLSQSDGAAGAAEIGVENGIEVGVVGRGQAGAAGLTIKGRRVAGVGK